MKIALRSPHDAARIHAEITFIKQMADAKKISLIAIFMKKSVNIPV
jgi:hypothetical protein